MSKVDRKSVVPGVSLSLIIQPYKSEVVSFVCTKLGLIYYDRVVNLCLFYQ